MREVKEETGAARELGRELPTTSYRDEKGRSKVVRYWVMRPVQGDAGPRKRSTRSADFPSPRPKTFLRRPRSSGPRGFCEWPEEQMSILLVRHATAGKRKRWRGDDRLRPLDERGLRQAAGLPAALSDYEVKAIYSSPYVRCRQTVEPLAAELGLELQEREELAEGARRSAVLELAGKDDPGTVVLCTHGDVVNDLLGEETEKGPPPCSSSSTGTSSSAATCLPPPDALDEPAGAKNDAALARHDLRDLIERNFEEPCADETGPDGERGRAVLARVHTHGFDRADLGELSVNRKSLAAREYRARHLVPLPSRSIQPCPLGRTPWVTGT